MGVWRDGVGVCAPGLGGPGCGEAIPGPKNGLNEGLGVGTGVGDGVGLGVGGRGGVTRGSGKCGSVATAVTWTCFQLWGPCD
jgi:hypothetical protein